MTRRLRRVRLLVALFAVSFAVFVAMAFKTRPAAPDSVSPERLDPSAIVESSGGTRRRYTLDREDGHFSYDQLFTYADGSTRMQGVTIVGQDRAYTLTADEARGAKGESAYTLTGHVRIASTDGLTATTDEATYTEAESSVAAPGTVAFSRGRLAGQGVGMTYGTAAEVLTILADADIHVAPGADGSGRLDLMAERASFPRTEHIVQLEGSATIQREGHVIAADTATAHLSHDDARLLSLELRGGASVTATRPPAGALESLAGRDVDLQYGSEGDVLESAHIDGDGSIQLAGSEGHPGRGIAAEALDVQLAPDGSTPVALTGRAAVTLTLPVEAGDPERRIEADELAARGEAGKGLTSARFTGRVTFRETGSAARVATSGVLDASLAPSSGGLDEARFSRVVRFTDGALEAHAAAARYRIDKGIVELTGSEPATPVPSVANAQIDVRAARVDLTLDGPRVHATGDVKSVIKPAAKTAAAATTKMPALLDDDQPVTVTSDELQYDGAASSAVYTGRAWLWQRDTSFKADTLTLDTAAGNLSASGSVTSTTALDENGEDGKIEKVASVATADEFSYDDAQRLGTYTGSAHVSGPSRDMTAARIELYLAEGGGDTLERVEAYEAVTLREHQRETKGSRMTYTAADERYLVTGTPATIVDECDRETTGQRISFLKASDTVSIDGGTQRATTQGGSCP